MTTNFSLNYQTCQHIHLHVYIHVKYPIPSADFPEGLQNELLPIPHEAQSADDVAHTEEVDPVGAGQEDDEEGHPVHVGEEATLNHI